MLGGYTRRILRVDLTNKKISVQELQEDLLRRFIGGSGLAAKILFEETNGSTDPLGPDNLLIFMTGPFTGTKILLSGRHAVVAKSPLTGIFGESDVGGTWGSELKRAGYDGIIFKGRAEKPIYLWIDDGDIEFRDAGHLWGKDTYEVDEIIRGETDDKAAVTSIGQAGERLARISAVMSDGRDGRAAARCGPGAVMGSKNLKAIAVRGESPPKVAYEDRLADILKEFGKVIVENSKALHEFGTSGGMLTIERLGDLPIKNWLMGRWTDGAERLSGQTMAKTILSGYYYCGACIVGCGRRVRISEGKYAPVEGGGPEYETLAMLGALCVIDDLKAIAKATELCNRYGLDVISTGAAIAFAIEAYDRGLLSKEDVDGMNLRWGNADAMVQMVDKIGRREGIGWLLGEGVARAAEKIGPLAKEFAIHTKNLEFPAHDPRAHYSIGLSYATSNRGACHLAGCTHLFERSLTMADLGYPEIQDRFATDGRGEFVAKLQNLMSMYDSLKLCKFLLFGGVKVGHMVEWTKYVTGWDMTLDEFMETGDRIFNMKRLYNLRCGISRKDDTLPPRILTHRRGEGGAGDTLPPIGKMLSDYYQYRGWDELGFPTKETLQHLGLDQYLSRVLAEQRRSKAA